MHRERIDHEHPLRAFKTRDLKRLSGPDQFRPFISDCGADGSQKAAAKQLLSGIDDVGIRHMEGPRGYSSADVARLIFDAQI